MSQEPIENNIPEAEEESTIFTSSPVREAKKKETKKSNKRMLAVISAALALCLIGGAIFAVDTFIPKSQTETSSTSTTSPVTPLSNIKVKSVKVSAEGRETVYYTTIKKSDASSAETAEWSVDGIDDALTESVIIASYMDTALRMQKMRNVEFDSEMDYGFETPLYTVTVKGYDEADDFEYIIGKQLSDGSGYYGQSEEGVFVLSKEDVDILKKPAEEMSIATVFPAASGSDSVYFSSGELGQFDTITVGGMGKDKVVLEKNPNDSTVSVIGSVMTSPAKRYANDELVDELFNIAKNGLDADYAYEYNPTAATLASYRLDNPDLYYKITFGDGEISFKASVKELGYYAVIADNNPNIIFKVPAESITFADYEKEDYASPYVFLEMMSELGEVSFTSGGKTNVFDITYFEEEDAEQDFIIKVDGRTIESDVFIAYYDYLLGIELSEKTFKKESGESVLTVRAKYANGSGERVLKFVKYSERRYYVEADGTPVGFITSAYMEKLLDNLSLAVAGKEVPKAF